MPNKNKKTDSQVGAYRFCLDRWREQIHFLRSIEQHVPEALTSLKASVLPLYAAARNKFKSIGSDFISVAPDPITGEVPFWSAIWDWARDWHLVEAKDVPNLKNHRVTSSIAYWLFRAIAGIGADIGYSSELSSEPFGPFDPESSAILFALSTLVHVVENTLDDWYTSKDLSKLTWTIPDMAEVALALHKTYGAMQDTNETPEERAEAFQTLMEDPFYRLLIERGKLRDNAALLDPPPYIYKFTVPAWRVHKEKRGDAVDRIREDVEKQLQQQMDYHMRIAKAYGLEEHARINQESHFDWLAMYQVKGWDFNQVTEEVKKTWPNEGTRLGALKKTVFAGIQVASELVVGHLFMSWRRPEKRGRPKTRP